MDAELRPLSSLILPWPTQMPPWPPSSPSPFLSLAAAKRGCAPPPVCLANLRAAVADLPLPLLAEVS
ncbi:hypothetical protein E2562_035614 [Oryza meyeriana var. granulata]|uniref:Uncharacterized protein n=1 Tax=Oryza meyeriana var. granulata TaxID=110450 RepID=A0A6G1CB25_9ORYZ|nr:hypothetical protein E2562_035614 [Oryza meyeriana var. granulata]